MNLDPPVESPTIEVVPEDVGSMLKLTDCVVAGRDVISAEIEDGCVLMSVESGNYIYLREVAAEIWRKLSEPCSVADLCRHLGQIYDAPSERIEASVRRFLAELLDRGLVRRELAPANIRGL
jgi:hypothetical protein